jgi:hypothetical protein
MDIDSLNITNNKSRRKVGFFVIGIVVYGQVKKIPSS